MEEMDKLHQTPYGSFLNYATC